jgi:hypothetical protein
MKKKTSAFVILLTFAITTVSYATIYHVRTDGHDASCNGSADAPAASAPNCAFLTIPKGISVAVAGDTVTVHTGTYAGSPNLISSVTSGINGNPITIQAHGTDIVTTKLWKISHDYINLIGFEVNNPRDATLPGIYISGSNCQIKNNRVYNGYMGNPGSYAMVVAGSNNLIENNLIEGSPLSQGGVHTGSDGDGTLTDNTKSFVPNSLVGLKIFNYGTVATGGNGSCIITSNTATTVTCTLSAGSYKNGVGYTIGPTFYIVFANSGSNNIYSRNIVRNLIDNERIWDLFGDNNLITGNHVYNTHWGGYTYGSHPDIFQVVDNAFKTSNSNVI